VRAYLEAAGAVPRPAVGVLAPHAGFPLAGPTIAAAFAAVDVPACCIVLGPNHRGRTGAGQGGSVLLGAAYRTPLGDVPPDAELGRALAERAGALLVEDPVAHEEEYAIEVVLPFLQARNPGVRIVPLVIAWHDWERSAALARAVHEATAGRDDVLLVASSDMNHHEPEGVTADKDTLALDRIIAADGEGLLEVTRDHRVSMCGRVPVAVALEVARLRGKRAGEVVAYSNSGIASGRSDRVVGFAAALIGIA
jgi:AmmeMemoRadiSam system protein B